MDYDTQQAQNNAINRAECGLAAGQAVDHAQMMRDQRIQSAIWALSEARRVRADGDLMEEVRVWVKGKRAEFMALLDELGEK